MCASIRPPSVELASPTHKCRGALIVITAALVIGAVLILVLPLRLPFSVRFIVAASDLLAAVVIALILRQTAQSSKPPNQ